MKTFLLVRVFYLLEVMDLLELGSEDEVVIRGRYMFRCLVSLRKAGLRGGT